MYIDLVMFFELMLFPKKNFWVVRVTFFFFLCNEKEMKCFSRSCSNYMRFTPSPNAIGFQMSSWRIFPLLRPFSSSAGIEVIEESTLTAGYEEVESVDSFAKAKLTNFLKRRNQPLKVEMNRISSGSGNLYSGKIALRLGDQFGDRFGEGIARTQKVAEGLALMHAVRIIDAVGIPLMELQGSQKRHAEAVRKAGRWAPLPGDPERPTAPNPPVLRERGAITTVAGEEGKEGKLSSSSIPSIIATFGIGPQVWDTGAPETDITIVKVQNNVDFLPCTLLSPAILDRGSFKRVFSLRMKLGGFRHSHADFGPTKVPKELLLALGAATRKEKGMPPLPKDRSVDPLVGTYHGQKLKVRVPVAVIQQVCESEGIGDLFTEFARPA